jgi:hypothetical protein
VAVQESFPLGSAVGANNPHRFVDRERALSPATAELAEIDTFYPELRADALHVLRRGAEVSSDVHGIDAGRPFPVIHNAFWVPGKVPSLNDLLDAKGTRKPIVRSIIMRAKPGKGKQRGGEYDLYNDIKQDWKLRTIRAIGAPFVRIAAAHFAYLVVESERRRDPSNICSAAIKFIEDGLVAAGVIPNDGWDNVLGIRVHWLHRPGREPGVYVVMSDEALSEEQLAVEYEETFLQQVF